MTGRGPTVRCCSSASARSRSGCGPGCTILASRPGSCGTRSTSRSWPTSTCKASTSSTCIRPLESSSSPLASALLGNEPLGWRIMPTFFGLALLAAGRGARLVLPQREGRRAVARHLLLRGDHLYRQLQGRGYGHLSRLPGARRLPCGAEGRGRRAGDLRFRVARAGHRHQVGGLPRGRARRLRPVAKGTVPSVSWGGSGSPLSSTSPSSTWGR